MVNLEFQSINQLKGVNNGKNRSNYCRGKLNGLCVFNVHYRIVGVIMAYTLKKSINGLTFDDIKRIYDNNPNMTLRELSNLTGYAIPFLKKLLLGG